MLWHNDFFTLPNGEIKYFYKIANSQNPLFIQHPHFRFGYPWNPHLPKDDIDEEYESFKLIYSEKFEIPNRDKIFDFANFQALIKKNCNLKPEELLWYETEFWSILIGETTYMGMGSDNLSDVLFSFPESNFALCISTSDSVILLNSGNAKNKSILVSVYALNEVLPFAEIVHPIKKSIETYDSVDFIGSKMLLERDLRRYWSAKRPVNLDPIAYVLESSDSDYKMLPVVKNEHKRSRDPIVGKTINLMGTTRGGFIESDYATKCKYLLNAEIWNFDFASIVEYNFELLNEDNSNNNNVISI